MCYPILCILRNFFERRVSEYQKAGVMSAATSMLSIASNGSANETGASDSASPGRGGSFALDADF